MADDMANGSDRRAFLLLLGLVIGLPLVAMAGAGATFLAIYGIRSKPKVVAISATANVEPQLIGELQVKIERGQDDVEVCINEITNHKWWRRRPTRQQAENIAQFIVDTNRGHFVWIAEDLRTYRAKIYPGMDSNSPISPGNSITERQMAEMSLRPAAIDPKSRYFWLFLDDAVRPTKIQALKYLKAKLDILEYRDGRSEQDAP
jgi:hypothetical protein